MNKSLTIHKKKHMLIMILVITYMSLLLTGCGAITDDVLIEDCIVGFIDSINEGDLDSALQYVDKKSQTIGNIALSLGDSLIGQTGISGIGVSDILGLGMTFATDGSMFDVYDMQIDYTSDNTADVYCIISIDDPNDDSVSEEETQFDMVYSDGEWYIDLSDELKALGGMLLE